MHCPDGGKCHHSCGEMCWREKSNFTAMTPTGRWPSDPTDHWDRRGLALAKLVASWSKDPSTQCGAAVMRPNRTIASVGFNGFPIGCCDAEEVYADREEKYGRVVHAEVNAIVLCPEPMHGYTMYTYPAGSGPSCDRCTAVIIQAGITRVVHEYDPDSGFVGRWGEAMQRGLQIYEEAGVEVVHAPLGSSG